MRRLVFHTHDVLGFSPPGTEERFASRMLVDRESVGSEQMTLNHFTLRAGCSTDSGSHPAPYDEVYYVLEGSGLLRLGEPAEEFRLGPGTIAFIPAGTLHQLECTGGQDLLMLTVMAFQPTPGVNDLYDARKRAWGTSFRLAAPDNG